MLFVLLKDFFHKYMQDAFHKENYSEGGWERKYIVFSECSHSHMLRQANLVLLPFNTVELNIQKEIWVDEYVHPQYSVYFYRVWLWLCHFMILR